MSKVVSNKWIQGASCTDQAALWRLVCLPSDTADSLSRLHARFACSTQADVQALFAQEHPAVEDAALLAFMEPDAASRYGFLTHQEWALRRYQQLYADGMEHAEILFWKRLRLALGSGPWWFGRIWWLILAWGGFALIIIIIKPGPLWLVLGCLPALVAIGVRYGLVMQLQPILGIHYPKSRAWRFLDGPARCTEAIAGRRDALRSLKDLTLLLRNTNQEISGIKSLQPLPAQVPPPPRFSGLYLASALSWVLFSGLLLACVWQIRVKPPSLKAFRLAWTSHAPATAIALSETAEDPEPETLIPWNYRTPSEAKQLIPQSSRQASPHEIQVACERGRAMLARFKPESVSDPILVQLPSEKGFLFAIYDRRKDALSFRNLIVLTYNPMPRSWLQIEDRKVFVYAE